MSIEAFQYCMLGHEGTIRGSKAEILPQPEPKCAGHANSSNRSEVGYEDLLTGG